MKDVRCYLVMTWGVTDCHTNSGKVCFVASNFCYPQILVPCSFFLLVTVSVCGQVALLLCAVVSKVVWWEVHSEAKPLALQETVRKQREKKGGDSVPVGPSRAQPWSLLLHLDSTSQWCCMVSTEALFSVWPLGDIFGSNKFYRKILSAH